LFNPFIDLNLPGLSFVMYNSDAIALYNISLTKEDLPLPDTPVTQVNVPNGNLALIFFRLFCSHPISSTNLPLPFLLAFGISIFSFPLKYLPDVAETAEVQW
jgi:hypothetical protein